MPYYVKVTKKVKEAIVPSYVGVTKTADGNYLLYQSALSEIEGNTLSERAERVGGALLNVAQARMEINGTTSPAACHTPKEYGGEDETEGESEPSGEAGASSAADIHQEVEIPSVEVEATASVNMGNNNQEESETSNNNQEESEVNNE